MTFTEAAAHVLKLVGKPLHYKEITDVAIEKELLSHVGKSPEVTMGARLAAVVKKDPRENPLVRVKPGVFALRDWDSATVEEGLQDRTPALERLAQLEVTRAANPDALAEAGSDSEVAKEPLEGDEDEDDEVLDEEVAAEEAVERSPFDYSLEDADAPEMAAEERTRAERAAAASEVFVAEDDDDKPILGGNDEDEDEDDSVDAGGRRRRRRRRRNGRSNVEDEGLPSYTVSEAPAVLEAPPRSPAAEAREAEEAPAGRRNRRGERRPNARAEGRPPRETVEPELGGIPAPARLLALAEEVVASGARQPSLSLKALCEQLGRKLEQDPSALSEPVADALRLEELAARHEGRLPKLHFNGKSASASEWAAEGDLARAEMDLRAASDRYSEVFERHLGKRLAALPARSLSDVVRLLLHAMGFGDVRAVRRQGGHHQEAHFSAVADTLGACVPAAVVLRRDGRDLGREKVIEARGALHHYAGGAAMALLVTTGQVLSGAREEAAIVGAAPVRLLDGVGLARACLQYGVGVRTSVIKVAAIDGEFLDSLKNT